MRYWHSIALLGTAATVLSAVMCRVRIASGITRSELLASQVAEAQRCLLAGVNQEHSAAEMAMYDAMLAQAAADAKARVGFLSEQLHWNNCQLDAYCTSTMLAVVQFIVGSCN